MRACMALCTSAATRLALLFMSEMTSSTSFSRRAVYAHHLEVHWEHLARGASRHVHEAVVLGEHEVLHVQAVHSVHADAAAAGHVAYYVVAAHGAAARARLAGASRPST